jgi:hypothetical protein
MTTVVAIGTSVIEVPDYIRNPLTGNREKVDDLSDDGYLKPFLALLHDRDNADLVDLGTSPVLTFDEDRWEYQKDESGHVLVKREAESRHDELVLEGEP